MAQTVTRWLLITLILSLGFGQHLRYELSFGPLYLHDILVALILVFNCKVRNFVMPPGYKYILIGLGVGWLNALTQYSIFEILVPMFYTLRLLAYLVLYAVLKNTKIVIPRKAFLVAGATTAAVGLTQYFLMPDMRVFQYLGWDDHLNRLTLPHFDPTFTGVMLVLTLLMLTRREWLLALTVAGAMMLTYARSVWLSLALTAGIFIQNKKIVVIAICLFFSTTLLLPKRFGEGTNLLRTYSITSRITADANIIKNASWTLITGRGYNTSIIGAERGDKGYPNHAAGANSSYIIILSTMGIIGLYGWYKFLRHLYTTSSHKSTIVFIALASLFNNVLLYPFVLLWVLLFPSKIKK